MGQEASYTACLKTMYGLRRFGIKLGLSVIRNILSGLGNPQDTFSTVHVAGSNGKGSVASMLAAIMHESGYKVGLYTSPHLVRFNERVCVNGEEISDDHVVRAYNEVLKVHQGDREPTFFEITTAMAFYEFGRERVDWAIIETGMGGRLDATNIVTPAVSIITNISKEHCTYLGNNISQIAFEKGGIIKDAVPLVTGVRKKSAITMIEGIAAERNAPIYRLGKDFRVRRNRKRMFTYFGIQDTWRNLKTALPGDHQVENAALALSTCEVLRNTGTRIPINAIRKGISENVWPGRLEIVATSPMVILDGAHNLAAARHLATYLSEQMAGKKIILVIGILDDKPYTAMLQVLVPVCHRVILTRAVIDRALAPEVLLPIVKAINPNVFVLPDVAAAVNHAIDMAKPDEIICIAGSLYVVGEAKAGFNKTKPFSV